MKFLIILFLSVNLFSGVNPTMEAKKLIKENKCDEARNILLKLNMNEYIITSNFQLHRQFIYSYIKCDRKDFDKAEIYLKKLENIDDAKEDRKTLQEEIAEAREVYTPQHVNKFVTFIYDKGFDYILIFIAVFVGMLISKLYEKCDEYNNIKMIRNYLKALKGRKKIDATLSFRDVKYKYKRCVYFNIFISISIALFLYIFIISLLSFVFYPVLITLSENSFIFITVLLLLLLSVYIMYIQNNLSKIKYSDEDDYILQIAMILQKHVLLNSYEHLYESIKELVIVHDDIFGPTEESSIYPLIANDDAKDIIKKTFNISRELYPEDKKGFSL